MNSRKPNIIIVMTDQQRADLRKSRGFSLDTMPFLDEWSSGGVDFSRAYTSNPICVPARVSLFTGRYAESHHVRTNHNASDAYFTEDLLDVLKKQGYRTALCGKNHSHRQPEDFDFCEENGHLGHETEINRTREEEIFADYLAKTKHMETHEPSPGGVEVQFPYRNVSSALRFIDSTQDQPFFAWVSFAEPHNPFQVPLPYYDMFPPESLPEIETSDVDLETKGHHYSFLADTWKNVLGPDYKKRILRTRSNYYGMLRLIDDQFKRLVNGLEERGLADQTIVVYLSDHGDFAGEYGLIRKGAGLSEMLVHIPMIWRGPGISAEGIEQNHFVSIVDVMPTMCRMLGLDIPFGCQGRNLTPLLNHATLSEMTDARKNMIDQEFNCVYAESGYGGLYWYKEDHLSLKAEGALNGPATFDCLNSWTQSGKVRMLRKGSFRIQVDMMGKGYLYDHSQDPYEIDNLWHLNDYLKIKCDLLSELMAASLRAMDPMPAPHARYRIKRHVDNYWQTDFISEDPGVENM